jgi:UDPglucose 6-dehydrogenase
MKKGRLELERIFIVGSGVVGKATGRGFTDMGHKVTFVDVQQDVVERLKSEGYDARIGLDLSGEPDSYIFLTLPTPHRGREYDLTAFEQGVRDVGNALRDSSGLHTVVVRSTVPPKTTVELVGPLLAAASGKQEGVGFCLANNPEFLRAASAAEDFRWPWMTVIGARNRRLQERLTELLSPFGGALRVFDDPTVTETIKCANNLFNATKISFWNEMWLVCQALDIDHDQVAGTVAQSAEGSLNPQYGTRGGAPYGGVCLPKDTNGFLGVAAGLGVAMPLLDAVVRVNDSIADQVREEIATVEGGRHLGFVPRTEPNVAVEAQIPAWRRDSALNSAERATQLIH